MVADELKNKNNNHGLVYEYIYIYKKIYIYILYVGPVWYGTWYGMCDP
jgi:hypothetical protein